MNEIPPWLLTELGITGATPDAPTPDTRHYVHVLELAEPREISSGSGTDKIVRCLAEAMKRVGTEDERRGGRKDAGLRALFRHHLQRRRFLFSLLTPIAAEATEDSLTAFFEHLLGGTRGPIISMQDRVIEAVLDFWYAHPHDSVEPAFCEELLRHLAVIGAPVRGDVLAICPRVRARARSSDPERSIADTIHAALELLYQRNLAFRLQPPGGFRDSPERDRRKSRYVVHRAIRRYMFRKLGSQRLEPSEANLFTVSLYMAQQREYPRLSAAAYQFIYELVDGLANYPSPDRQQDRDPDFAARALRAALGVARGLFSIGVVSRFSELGGITISRPDRMGHFEHHRLLVLWLLRNAQNLDRRYAEAGKGEPWWPPFYRDEIVWLANECGVFSYAQGQIYDASALFWLGSQGARRIEGLGSGPMRSRILLNDAWCCIDRARLDDAESRLREVVSVQDEEPLLHLIARGGQALIQHIRGHSEAANDAYRQVIKELLPLKSTRPLAITQRNFGELKRHMGRYHEADVELQKAVEIAEAGGYVELVHHARVARTRNAIGQDAGSPDRFREVLDEAHDYAEKMHLDRLLCDVLQVRAELLMKYGHSVVAGQFATRAIRIATLNGMILRKIAFLELLGRIEHSRGDSPGATRLIERTIRFARQVGYTLIVERAAQTYGGSALWRGERLPS